MCNVIFFQAIPYRLTGFETPAAKAVCAHITNQPTKLTTDGYINDGNGFSQRSLAVPAIKWLHFPVMSSLVCAALPYSKQLSNSGESHEKGPTQLGAVVVALILSRTGVTSSTGQSVCVHIFVLAILAKRQCHLHCVFWSGTAVSPEK